MARAQDKAAGNLPARTFCYRLDVPVNTISTNKSFTQVVVGGRNVFKILDITDNGFNEKLNLRVGRINLNFSITDVMWHHLDDNIIATAAGNGAVALWDLSLASKSKQEYVFTDHKRTVNKICFHPTDDSILLSGSQDGTINCFDIRKKCVAVRFFGRADSVRDVQFSPFERNWFAAACEGGCIQIWDRRRTDNFLWQFSGHSGPVFSMDWHPEDRSWLGTGGRDKTIKVWNVHTKSIPIHCVPTIAEVACVRWRPRGKYHIASSALVIDHHVNVWDIRRPYIPFAAFTEHNDVATGIIWHKESDILLSCSKDSLLYQHVFQDALRPAEHAPPVALGFSCRGDVCNACSNQLKQSSSLRKASVGKNLSQQVPSMPAFFKKTPATDDDFKSVHSTLKLFTSEASSFNEAWIETLAKRFIFSGKPFQDICTHNEKVCREFNMPHKAQTWMILRHVFSDINASDVSRALSSTHPSSSDDFASNNHNRGSILESVIDAANIDDVSSIESEDNEDVYPTINNKTDDVDLAVGADLDAILQDEQFEGQFFPGEAMNDELQDWAVPSEAFQPRHSIGEKSLAVDHSALDMSTTEQASGLQDHVNFGFTSEKHKAETSIHVLQTCKFLALPEWDFKPLVVEMLRYFAEQGDVQMAVTALLALQDRIGNEIDISIKEEWFNAYLELLNRFRLWTIAAKIIKLSNLPNISSLNQDSTTINTICAGCNKPMPTSSGWFCKRCMKNAAPCSICHLPVKGLYVWCQGCGHGGHLVHVQEWMVKNRECPAGCGHRCVFS
eukprot:gene11054-12220_t